MKFEHTSVLLKEVLDNLAIKPDGIYVDGTLGGGGHSYHILERLTSGGRLIGIDQDTDAIRAAGERLSCFEDQVTIVHDNYEHILSISAVDGILLDLGVSSYQLDNPERGFTYRTDAPLDMRMDQSSALTAREIVNTWSQEEIARILREYGEERCAGRIAANIVRRREKSPLETTVLRDSLDTMIDLLKPGGRLCVITFHSLEDRIVKNAFKRNEKPCICPPEFPVCVCGRESKGRVVTRKAIAPGAEELKVNRRSASAKLRVFEKK